VNFPLLARGVVEASRDAATSKLPKGLYVVATPIGNLGDISLRALWVLSQIDRVACEDTRVSGALLAHYGIKKPLLPYHDHNADKARPQIMQKLQDGESVALVSDAGMPLVADPGFKLVRACREAGYPVTVIPGANAALAALAGSGLPVDPFYFAGFPPPKSAARRKWIAAFANVPSSLLIYEAPQRVAATLADLEAVLGAARPAAIARELTKLFEETIRSTLGELAAHFNVNEARGEFVLIVGPPTKAPPVAEMASLDDLLRTHLRVHSLRDAVAVVSAETGIKKAEVYARALWLKGKSSQ